MSQCQACDGSMVMDSKNLVMLVKFEVYQGRVPIVWLIYVQLSDVKPRIGASFGRRATDGVFWGQFEAVIIRHLCLAVIKDHVANGCDATIATCNLVAFLHISDFLGAAISHLDGRVEKKPHVGSSICMEPTDLLNHLVSSCRRLVSSGSWGSTQANPMPPKRRLWKDEQKMTCGP